MTSRRQILSELPFGRHQQDTIALGPDGRLYLGSGSTCDVCREQDPRSGAILSFKLDGSDYPLGLAVEPGGGLLVGDWGRGVVYRLRKR